MPRRITLSRITLRYADKLVLHTASSGTVPGLDELRLVIHQDGALAGIGASRINIRYLNGLDPEMLARDAVALCRSLRWQCEPEAVLADCDAANPPGPLRMLVEMAVRDAEARIRDVPLAVLLGGALELTTHTNQTLFWTDDAAMLARAGAYLARGFSDLKLRVGAGTIDDDLRRLALLRGLAPEATLSADANGRWTVEEAETFIAGAAPLGLVSLEQPLAPGERAGLARLTGTTIILDEEMASDEAVAWLAATRAAPVAHLKLTKLGGIDRVMAAARQLADAGVGIMVGQMNEGVPSTLAAAHVAMALGASLRELYGADLMVGDPCGALHYDQGRLHVPPGAGLGIAEVAEAGEILWEQTV
ncbi:mandelate racemase/muconate lactonizing enzyme family protein [Elioraea sp.]|uniref:mandelate racemase/muconate lactonizing enzyme family protein n=1 Tax=Elioraea sp. TaxID=2185103 RepID=UPI0025BE1686|nr:mandelate racemase/muconate lactonizing enzyme family protein [Elioraea sp.]